MLRDNAGMDVWTRAACSARSVRDARGPTGALTQALGMRDVPYARPASGSRAKIHSNGIRLA